MAAIAVSWFPGDERRKPPFHRVLDHLIPLGFPVCIGWDADRNRARSINNVARAVNSDVFVWNDADSLCPHEQILEAIRLAREAPGLVFAFDWYVRLTEDGSRGQAWMAPDSHACVAMRRDCFLEIGGMNENLVGWGPDDVDFNRRAAERWPHRRVHGEVVHLWHGDRRNDDSPTDTPVEVIEANRKTVYG